MPSMASVPALWKERHRQPITVIPAQRSRAISDPAVYGFTGDAVDGITFPTVCKERHRQPMSAFPRSARR
jgi:hypothetical protein